MHKYLLLVASLILISACTQKIPELKSPCVSADVEGAKDPCGPRRPVNSKWVQEKGLV